MTNQYKNLTELLQLVPDDKKPVAKKIVTELNFMSSTLTQLRKLVKEQGPVVLFKNGKPVASVLGYRQKADIIQALGL